MKDFQMGNETINEDNNTQNTATGQSGALWLKRKKGKHAFGFNKLILFKSSYLPLEGM